jgi:hypothetical protein
VNNALDRPRVDAGSSLDIAVVAAVNDRDILDQNLKRSELLASPYVQVRTYEGCRSAAEAYNAGLDDTTAEYVLFVHQDVYLPRSWADNLRSAISHLNRDDPTWAVLGVYGIEESGHRVGTVWSTGLNRELSSRLSQPRAVVSVDELAIVLRRASGLRFDAELVGFHLYGTDIVMTARATRQTAYVAYLPVIHNSRPVRSTGGPYAAAYRYMRKKWWSSLPIPTAVCPLTRSRLPLWRHRLSTRKRGLNRALRRENVKVDPVRKAGELGYE